MFRRVPAAFTATAVASASARSAVPAAAIRRRPLFASSASATTRRSYVTHKVNPEMGVISLSEVVGLSFVVWVACSILDAGIENH